MTKRPDFFPISVWYGGGKARAPMLSTITADSRAEWKKDLEQIKSLGFNTVRTWVDWSHCEPRPGEYHFENLELLLKLAQEVGLKVFIQVYVDSAPDWVGKKYPDAQFEAQSGEKVYSQTAPGFCTDHPGVREAVLNFYTETAKVATRYPNFYGWDLWSEPHIINWAIINYVPNAQFCFCPYTRARFRLWLKDKYGSLDTLNKAWYRNFESFDDVEPPRFGTILSYTDFIDWKHFIMEKLAEDLRMRGEAIRKVDKTHILTSHSAVPSLFTSPLWGEGNPDDFLMAEVVDFYGTSLYPKHSFPKYHWSLIYFISMADFSRSANIRNGGFYVGELQAGYGTRGVVVGNPVTAGDLRSWMWSVIAKGARGVHLYAYYPMSSGYESGGYGLVTLDGSITERAKASGKIAEIVSKNMNLFLNSRPLRAEIALVYNPLAQLVGGEQHSGPQMALRDSLLGYYRVLMEHNIPVDFIHRRDVETQDLSQYRLIIVPYPIMFTREAAEGLRNYIKNGGCVVAEARLAWNDESGHATNIIPGMGLDEVFGVRELSVEMADEVNMRIAKINHPALAKLKEGTILKGAYFSEALKPLPQRDETRVLAYLDNGSPVMVASKFGKGETIFIGTFLGLEQYKNQNKENEQFVLGLLEWAGVERAFTSSSDGWATAPVEIRLQEHPGGNLLFAINHSESEQTVKIALRVDSNGNYSIHNIITGTSLIQSAKDNTLKIEIPIPAKDAAVLNIESADSKRKPGK
ncbi:beta-galactosidase [Candidatus Sumerlaeota bacterium]|nr:beta-galactosidase [Candidatus Sumerlaeota bacterium]